MSVQPARYYTPEEYLQLEEKAEYKNEYYQGKIYAMSGVSRHHMRIASNLTIRLGNLLESGPCNVNGSDLRVQIEATGLYTYPDLSVVCEDERYSDGKYPDSLLNPLFLVEILSKSTERYDRGTKFDHYRQIPSLQEYVLISQDKPKVESYLRQDDGERWLLTIASGLDARIEFKSLGVVVELAAIYRRVNFPPELKLTDAAE